MRIVLVSIHPFPSPQAVPLAAACLKAAADGEPALSDVHIELVNFFPDTPPLRIAEEILQHCPDAVGFSMYLWNRAACLSAAASLGENEPGLVLFAGGPEATADFRQLLHLSPMDFIVVGEGETPFVEAVRHMSIGAPLTEIPGIACKDAPDSYVPAEAAAPENLVSPYLSGVLAPMEGGGVLWELSRGCSFGCEFCFDNKGGRGVRTFSIERISAELQLFVRKQAAQVFVLDSTFNQNMKRAKAVLRLIEKQAPHIHFHFEVRSEFIDEELAELFSRITCSLQIGLQSADPVVQRGVGRIFNPVDFADKISILNNSGAVFGFDLIYGLPGDSLAGFCKSLDYALSLYPNHLDIFPLAVLPGTRLSEKASELGLEWETAAPYTVRSSAGFPESDMHAGAALARACDIFYSRGKAVAWFNTVIRALHMQPAGLLAAFASWLTALEEEKTDEARMEDDQIWNLQREFLQYIFRKKKKVKLLPLVLDLADYHYYYARALLSPVPELPTDRELENSDLLTEDLSFAPSASLVRFNYEIVDILEAGEFDLEDFARCFVPEQSHAVIYPRGGEIFTESLNPSYFQLLQGIAQGERTTGIMADLDLEEEEIASFLEFAAAEGIILLAKHEA